MIIKSPEQKDISQLRLLWQEAFGDTDTFLDSFFSAAFAPERCRCAVENGQVAAALYWFSCEVCVQPIAYIYAVATAKAFRGRGICRKLMANTHKHLKEQGYAGVILVPGDLDLRNMYRAMGYEDMTGIRQFSCNAGTPVALEKIEAEEYARLRRAYLPKNAVVQEGENLRFLECMAQFYKGKDFILCAAQENDQLTALELLGNEAAATGIVATMGCTEGTFTMPGEEPFAMGIPFTPDFQKPKYFAFAFN